MKSANPKFNNDESFEEWGERVTIHEKQKAIKELSNGGDIDQILENFANRVTTKLLHPIFKAIQSSAILSFDVEEDKRRYSEIYINKSIKHNDNIIE